MFRERPLPEVRITLIPTARHIRWLRFLNLHGPLPSQYLFDLEGEKTESQRRAAQQQLTRLWIGGYVQRPRQQRATENSNYHHYVYDLTDEGRAYLQANGLRADALRPTGNFVHQLFVACVTATIDIMCQREGYRYIPPHEYLDGRSPIVDVPFAWDGKTHKAPMAPDAVFAIDYGNGSFIAFALEADRNTEPNTSNLPNRKSDLRSIRQYASFIGKKLYRQSYGREAMMVLLYVTVSAGHAANFTRLAADELGSPIYVAVGVVPEFQTPFRPPLLLRHLFEEGLIRPGREPFTIKKP